MIRYQFKWGLQIHLTVDNPDDSTPIQFDGNEEFAAIVMSDLSKCYGAFGHLIGNSCTAPDLAAAMLSPTMQAYKPKLLEGEELTKAVANIPDGAKT